MKNNSAFKFLKNSFSLEKINKLLFKNRNDKKYKEKTSFVNNISKFERYKNLIEKFNQFKKDELVLESKNLTSPSSCFGFSLGFLYFVNS